MAIRLRSNDPANNQPVNDFLNLLGRCLGFEVFMAADGTISRAPGPPAAETQPFTEVFDDLTSLRSTVTVTVGRGQADVFFDLYERREVDLDDIEQLPEPAPPGSPSAFTRCECLIHVLAEYLNALQRGRTMGGAGFREAHAGGGFSGQNQHRVANGQQGRVRSNKGIKDAAGRPIGGIIRYSNNARTRFELIGGNVRNVMHIEPPP